MDRVLKIPKGSVDGTSGELASQRDVRLAVQLGQECFPSFDVWRMAVVLFVV